MSEQWIRNQARRSFLVLAKALPGASGSLALERMQTKIAAAATGGNCRRWESKMEIPDYMTPWRKSAAIAYSLAMVRGASLHFKYRSRTMISSRAYAENLSLLAIALKNESLKDADIVECGTWRGGMSAGMVEVGGFNRDYYFFDSFEGLPPVKEIDGKAAKAYEDSLSTPGCVASEEDFRQTMSMTGCPQEKIHTCKGFFENSFSGFSPPKIAALRLDCDWYDSVLICLKKFWDHILPGGLILIDDYHGWEGCSKAVHEFLASRVAPESIRTGPIGRVTFIIKKPSPEVS